MKNEKNFTLKNIGLLHELKNRELQGRSGKYFAKEDLGLTGSEVSINCMPAGQGTPFVHVHKKNEELYIITHGKGIFFADGEEFPIQEGSLIRVAPKCERAIKASNEDLCFICIQSEASSLTQFTKDDASIPDTKTSWMK
jgi:mannose-6-phosphate isomerase-like protein (cupin superfamily)